MTLALVVAGVCVLAACTAGPPPAMPTVTESSSPAPPPPSSHEALAAQLRQVVAERQEEWALGAVIVYVGIEGEDVLVEASGSSMTGVPATVDMHFRNGAIAISLIATVALQLVDDEVLDLDDTIDRWLPDTPHADVVTVRQLLHMTAGYQDYVRQTPFEDAVQLDPFRSWAPEELLAFAVDLPLLFEPGTNWAYSHTCYVLLGLLLEQATGETLDSLLESRVLEPLGLEQTADPGSPWMPHPVLHAFTPERAAFLGVTLPGFLEESTYWSPSWTIARGGIQYTDIRDAAASMAAVGRGTLLSDEMHTLQISPDLRGRNSPVEGCSYCFPHSVLYSYGLGVVLSGDWVSQNPMFYGYSGASGHLPAEDVSIAVAATYTVESFDGQNSTPNRADDLMRLLSAVVVPDNPLPLPERLQ